MPIYQYRCEACKHETEVFLRNISDPHPTDCQACNKVNVLSQCVTAPGVRFNGQGYYETDEKPKDKQRHVLKKDEGCAA